MVTDEVSDSSVEKTMAPIVNTSKVAVGEVTRPVEIGGPSRVSIEVPADIPAEPLKEGTKLISPISLSSEQTRSARGEETPQLKMNEDMEKKSTFSEEILEQVVARIEGTVVEADGITLPTSPVEELGKTDMRSQESHMRMEKAEKAYRQLRDESTDELKLRLEKCKTGFAMWGLQTVKWLKLDSLERRVM
ncbi:hypothetical protein AXG93_1618s1000 [Marchantia polymorpha subsp. ruderalis]|uniref:Uncharacterized protein n=1 Tax=Marchantia polymorpha subsp. ruderalis TaxID=1480154 RepID=A0A176VPG7_MARPO|nr:hypothetical protein AXG93_1618s1000 [Marchantia polymorpha subsp. ruderalis]